MPSVRFQILKYAYWLKKKNEKGVNFNFENSITRYSFQKKIIKGIFQLHILLNLINIFFYMYNKLGRHRSMEP